MPFRRSKHRPLLHILLGGLLERYFEPSSVAYYLGSGGTLLSEPKALFKLDLNSGAADEINELAEASGLLVDRHTLKASKPGIFNCIVTWAVMDMGGAGGMLSAAPDAKAKGKGKAQRTEKETNKLEMEMVTMALLTEHLERMTLCANETGDS